MCKRKTPENTKEPKKNKKITKEEAKKRQIDQAATNIFFNGRQISRPKHNHSKSFKSDALSIFLDHDRHPCL